VRISSFFFAASLLVFNPFAFAGDTFGLIFTQTAGGPGITGLSNEFYIAGQNARVNIVLDAEPGETPLARFVDLVVPKGWTFAGVGGDTAPEIVPLSTEGTVSFGWLRGAPIPASFYVELRVPEAEAAERIISTSVRFTDSNGTEHVSQNERTRLRKDTIAPVITLVGAGITLDCQDPFTDPGYTASDNAEGDLTAQVVRTGAVDSAVPGRYTLTYTVSDRSGNTSPAFQRRVVVLDNCSGDTGPCDGNCADDDGTDTDGDGLTDCQETCIFGTNPVRVDSDRDGMSDEYEARFIPELDPLDASDRNLDADGDGISNFDEFLRDSNARDANDPGQSLYVAPTGFNGTDRGSRERPFRTIEYALSRAETFASAARPVNVILLPGGYTEDFRMRRFVNLVGDTTATVIGTITGLPDSELRNLTLTGATENDLLLDLTRDGGGFNMRIINVRFFNAAIGARLAGDGGQVVFDGCRFSNLEIGMEVRGTLPKVRRSIFQNLDAPEGLSVTGVLIRPLPVGAKQTEIVEGSLGDITDPSEGWNRFELDTINGTAVINERPTVVKMQLNDWGVNEEDVIASSIEGPAEFVPFLGAGASVLASTLVCTVSDAGDQSRIENATVTVTPGAYAAVTNNVNGVYTYPAVPDGLYTVVVNAPGYTQVSQTVTIAPGEIASVIVPLGEAPSGGCGGGSKSLPNPGDALVALIAIAGMLGSSLVWRLKA